MACGSPDGSTSNDLTDSASNDGHDFADSGGAGGSGSVAASSVSSSVASSSTGAGAGGAGNGSGTSCPECIATECGLDCILLGTCASSVHQEIYECLAVTCALECWGWKPPCQGGGDGSSGGDPSGCDCDTSSDCDGCWCEPAEECDTTSSSSGGDPGLGNCCDGDIYWHVGCDDPDVEACVCYYDSSCCSSQWTDACVSTVAWCGGASCP